MAGGVLTASLTLPFSGASDAFYSGLVYIKPHPGLIPPDCYMQLAIYPIHPELKIILSGKGEVWKAPGFTQVVNVENDYLNLGGSSSFTGRLPMDSGVVVHKDRGVFMDAQGNVLPHDQVNLAYNPETKAVESDRELIGFVPVSYNHQYGLYKYKPNIKKEASGGYSITLDVVYAFLGKSYAYYEVNSANLPEDKKIEVMVLYSDLLVTERGSIPEYPDTGAFEKPPNWTGAEDGAYPNTSFVLPAGTPTYEQKRVHVVWYYVGHASYLKREVYHVPYEQPYSGASFSHKLSNNQWVPNLQLEVRNIDAALEGITTADNKKDLIRLITDEYDRARAQYGI
jgi:hypothetical protein